MRELFVVVDAHVMGTNNIPNTSQLPLLLQPQLPFGAMSAHVPRSVLVLQSMRDA
jgi:hypothetical protein